MTTTGTYSFDPALDEIFTEAFERAGVDASTPGLNLIQSARRSLRFMLNSEWNTFGINQWQIHLGREVMTVGKSDFYLPAGAIDIWDAVLSRQGRETEMYVISRDEYLCITNKTHQGRPDRYYLDKTSGRPRAFFWQCGSNITDVIIYNYFRQMQDATHSNTPLKATLDMPAAALECCVAGLAWRIAAKFNRGVEPALKQHYGGQGFPDRVGGTIELMRQALRDRSDLDLYGVFEPRTSRR